MVSEGSVNPGFSLVGVKPEPAKENELPAGCESSLALSVPTSDSEPQATVATEAEELELQVASAPCQ